MRTVGFPLLYTANFFEIWQPGMLDHPQIVELRTAFSNLEKSGRIYPLCRFFLRHLRYLRASTSRVAAISIRDTPEVLSYKYKKVEKYDLSAQ